MNLRFKEVMNEMTGLRIKVASLRDGSARKGPECRRSTR